MRECESQGVAKLFTKQIYALTVVLLIAAPVLAQVNDDTVTEGNVERLPESTPVLEYILTGVFLLAALAIGFMPSKRVNEDIVLPRSGPL